MEESRSASSRYFCNRDCEYFPCHPWQEENGFNCLFCYCPLYPLGVECGGQCRVLPGGIKDCSDCLLPHRPENYELVMARAAEVGRCFSMEETLEGNGSGRVSQVMPQDG